MPVIRRADKNDIDLIRELTMQVWPQTYIPIIGAQQVAYMLEQFYAPASLQHQMDNGHTFIICSYNEVPAAFASFSETEPGIVKLHKLYILPGMQGKGIGRIMIKYITDNIAPLGAKSLRLNVNIHNHAAIAFYGKAGFTKLRDEDIDIGHGYYMNDHVLEMVL